MVPAPGASLLEGLPDCDLEFKMDDVRPGWEADTGVVVGDLSFRGEPLVDLAAPCVATGDQSLG